MHEARQNFPEETIATKAQAIQCRKPKYERQTQLSFPKIYVSFEPLKRFYFLSFFFRLWPFSFGKLFC